MARSQEESLTEARASRSMSLEQARGVDFYAVYDSLRTGGDFFDAVDLGSRVIFLLTDIAGTKEATQAIAAEVQATFRARAVEFLRPAEANVMDAIAQLTQEVNHALIRSAGGVRYAPTFLGGYDLSLGVLAYVNAGGMTAVFHDVEDTRLLGCESVPLGLFSHLTFEPSMQAFEPGAKLLLVTKAVVETEHGRTRFGVERLIPLVQNAATNTAAELCQAALEKADEFKQTPWYRRLHLPFGHRDEGEDRTALALVRLSG